MIDFRFIPALAIAMLSAAGVASAQTHGEMHSLRCAAATAYAELEVSGAGSGRQIFANGKPDLFDAISLGGADGGWWITDASPLARASVPTELVARIPREGNLSAGPQCATLRALFRAHRILYSAHAVSVAMRWRRHGQDSSCIIMISLPVLSDDGRRAVLARSNSCSGSSLELLERGADGGFHVVASKPLGVY